MSLHGKRILLTGASGGIGRELALKFASKGAELVLVGKDAVMLNKLVAEIKSNSILSLETLPKQTVAFMPYSVSIIICDLNESGAAHVVANQATQCMGGVDILVNCAGVSHFGSSENQSHQDLEKLLRINLLLPIQLTNSLLPQMKARGSGRIVNIGSIFGSISYPYFTSYSASKSGLRGFSQALRRELQNTGVDVTYVAPRYTHTPLNKGAIDRMAIALGMNADEPSEVAEQIIYAINKRKNEQYIGWPESLFVRINAIFPNLIDKALRQQTIKMREFIG